MITFFLAAALGPAAAATEVAFDQLVAGQDAAAITLIERMGDPEGDPARLLNLGIAYARSGDHPRARALFQAVYDSRTWVELETSTGEWVDSRTLARRALARLAADGFGSTARLARN